MRHAAAAAHPAERAGEQHIDRSALAKMVMQLFVHWGLSSEDQLALLGLSTANRAALTRYRKGAPLAQNRDLLDRVGILLGIHKSLRLLFPQNRDLAYAWMTRPNRAFDGMTPVEAIRQWGFRGLLMVRAYLDKARGR
ncbi:MAG TPA: DUF2384 domain-containing protein [Gammaproteobacteria bacterium]|nr:DUF2384 domain-containing protein [Gammaproteobacteria bacterium]